jgi:hypothetical protein
MRDLRKTGLALGRVAFAGLAGVAPALAATHARAGAWAPPAGTGIVIAGTGFTTGERYFTASGRLVPVPDYRKFELAAYGEYGITDRLTAVVASSGLLETIGSPIDLGYLGLGYIEAGGRALLIEEGAAVVSVQATGRVAGSHLRAWIGSDADTQVDLRALAGYGFRLGGWTGFVEGQLGFRWRDAPAANEIRADLTLGLRPARDWLVMLQSFSAIAAETGTGRPPQSETKLQLSAVYDLSARWALQLGGFATLVGSNTLAERGLLAAVWYRF